MTKSWRNCVNFFLILSIFSVGGIFMYFGKYGSVAEDMTLDSLATVSIGEVLSSKTQEAEQWIEGERGTNKQDHVGDMLTQKFTHKPYGFSFLYPSHFTVGEFAEVEGNVFLIQSEDSSRGFQLYVAPWDEESKIITPSRILEDLPDMVVKNPQEVHIAGGLARALIFESETEAYGETREVWFIGNKALFQITTRIQNDATIGPILETLRFE